MPYLNLAPPDWGALLGGSEVEAKWIADRDRKFDLIAEQVEKSTNLSSVLQANDALFRCTPELLQTHPEAADWYLSLAGIALNTLQYLREGPDNYGMTTRPRTIRDNLERGRPVSPANLVAFSNWINAEIDTLYPTEKRELTFARGVVMAILGARAHGQGQNMGGNDGVVLLKRQFVQEMLGRGHTAEVRIGDLFEPYRPELKLSETDQLRFAGRFICDFGSGGNRPDIRITDRGVVIAAGEIKARKDTSNIWESWMPQITDHMRTWTGDSPDAARLFFGTLVTEEMIEGTTASGVRRSGLKSLHANGLLTAAYNVSKIASDDPKARASFDNLLSALEARLMH